MRFDGSGTGSCVVIDGERANGRQGRMRVDETGHGRGLRMVNPSSSTSSVFSLTLLTAIPSMCGTQRVFLLNGTAGEMSDG